MGVDFEVNFGSIEKAFEYSELLRSPVPANLAQTQQRLSADTAVMIYTIWDESVDFDPVRGPFFDEGYNRPAVNSYCLVLTKDGLTAVTLDHDFNYRQAVSRLLTNVTEEDRNALYNALVKSALAHIPDNIQNLIIVPDSALEHLPFDILRENGDNPVLGEKYRLSVSPSVSGLVSYIREVKIDLRAVPQDAWQEGGKG
jgi:CHAT domain-containing protein